MRRNVFLLSFSVVGALTLGSATAGQHEGHQAGAAPSAAQVNECRQAQPVITELLNAALKRLEDARLTNSAAAMRDAADDVQAALVDMRAQFAPCSTMQAAPAPASAGAAAPATSTPPAASRTPATQPSSAPAATDPHVGHAAPAAPAASTPRTPAAPPARPSTAPPRSVPPATPDAPTGHTTPAVPATRTPAAAAARPSAAAQPAAPTSDAHAGHPTAPASAPSAATPSASDRTRAAAPPTNIAELKCSNAVDPKTAPRMLYQGSMYYFCTEASRAEFAKDPSKFVTASPQAAPAHAH